MDSRRVVFILSSDHSGSTLTDLILGSHSQCSSLGEWLHCGSERSLHCHVCNKQCDRMQGMRSRMADGETPHQAAFNACGTPVLSDSSKRAEWAARAMRKNSEVSFRAVILKRYGLATFRKHVEDIRPNPVAHFMRWVSENEKIDVFVESNFSPDDRLFLRYEDLVADPIYWATRLSELAGLEYERGQEDFWKHDHHILHGNGKPVGSVRKFHQVAMNKKVERARLEIYHDKAYEAVFNDSEKGLFKDIAGNLLKEYGYYGGRA